MPTRAIRFLRARKVPFIIVRYPHLRKGASFAAESIGYPINRVIKTLVVKLPDGQLALVLVPGDRRLDLKRFARSVGLKRVSMAGTQEAERATGYLVGGISPFATRRPMKVYIDEELMSFSEVAINGGGRGIMVKIDPEDICRLLNPKKLKF